MGQGERWSTRIVSAHLAAIGLPALWVSAWDVIRTDGTHRAATVDVAEVGRRVRANRADWSGRIPVMQGFVGSAPDGRPTTLGREGSDFSGALLAEALQAERFFVWKDVPGVMTGDPRCWPPAKCLPVLDHGTADILGKAGAGVLHQDTVAPIRRAGIPLHVRSFLDPQVPGTRIEGETPPTGLPPLWTMSVARDGVRQVRCIGGGRSHRRGDVEPSRSGRAHPVHRSGPPVSPVRAHAGPGRGPMKTPAGGPAFRMGSTERDRQYSSSLKKKSSLEG